MRIDWNVFGRISRAIQDSSIMVGEERTLTDEEVKQANDHLSTMEIAASSFVEITSKAKERWKKNIK